MRLTVIALLLTAAVSTAAPPTLHEHLARAVSYTHLTLPTILLV